MRVELTECEIDFIEQCIYMAAKEGYYSIDWDTRLNYDIEEVGRKFLRKLGLKEEIIDFYIRGLY